MLEEVEGFILNETLYGDTSKIIHVFTRKYGLISIMCKGAKSMKSKLRVPTMKYSYVRFNIYYKKDKISSLVSADIINPLKLIKSDILLVSFLAYISDLTNQVIKQSNEYEKIYDIFINAILKMDKGIDPLVLTNIVEIKYLEFLGVLFNLDECILCGSKKDIITFDADKGGYICKKCHTNEIILDKKIIKLFRVYYYVNISSIENINILKNEKETISKYIDLYYDRYTGLYLSTKEFLKKLM